jgi:endonuclease/exonuclease/phosphatase family metal-dependent hydrolase
MRITAFCFLIVINVSVLAQSVQVMTYNIRFATEQDGVNAWSKRKNKVFDLIKKYDPDVIGVQEALAEQLDDIIHALPAYQYVGVGRDDGKKSGEFSAILYKKEKLKILDQGTFWLSETPAVPGSKSWDAAITRVATWAKMKESKSGKTFLVINTHFDHIGKEARHKSASLLKTKYQHLGKGLPSIIMGDFNCTRDDAPYSVMVAKDKMNLIDPAPANPPGTYCTFKVNGMECTPIDYVFHSPDWAASDYLVAMDNDGEHYPSDHLPVLVRLAVKKNK